MNKVIWSSILSIVLVVFCFSENVKLETYDPDYFDRNMGPSDVARRASRDKELGNPEKVKEIMLYIEALNKENTDYRNLRKIEEIGYKQSQLCDYLGYGGENGGRILVDLITTGRVKCQRIDSSLGQSGSQAVYTYLMGKATTETDPLESRNIMTSLAACTYYYSEEQIKKIFNLCKSYADSKDPYDRLVCAGSLGRLKERAGIPVLEKLALDEAKNEQGVYFVREKAVGALNEIKNMKDGETRYSNARDHFVMPESFESVMGKANRK